ncbi:MAG TPA: hypothetical protein VG779_07470 [Actinomycetota bacterium]|nr:hypothetical protein [Actinomycetota bacterium]
MRALMTARPEQLSVASRPAHSIRTARTGAATVMGRVWRSVPGRRWSGARRGAARRSPRWWPAPPMIAVPPVGAGTAVTDLGTGVLAVVWTMTG